uniref:Uncharacterized protein n=1 Tax=Arcella intermedia TaxID=1963864 RepID=A0A6B2LWL6_9EUKA
MANASCLCWGLIWLIILLAIGWWIGFFCGWLWVLLSPITVCCDCLRPVTDLFERGMKVPKTCAENMMKGSSF